jgi:hypothetical protein
MQSAWMPYVEAVNCFRWYKAGRRVIDHKGRAPVAIEVRGSNKNREARLLFEFPRDREPLPVNFFCRQYAWLGS